ncbi:MAG: hypothetical protein V9H69_04595 [Anaerolineae bacterium]
MQLIRLEEFDHALRQGARLVAKAAVEEGLAAAGLAQGEIDLVASLAQQPHRGRADLRQRLVYDAGDEERDAGWLGHGRVPVVQAPGPDSRFTA